MKRLIPASRAIVLATGLVLATTAFAIAEDSGSAGSAPAAEEAKPFSPTIYVGPTFGYAEQKESEFAWGVHVMARPFRYGALQLEYFNLGPLRHSSGDFDGLYVGVMPILPVADRWSLFGQLGAAFSDEGHDVAAGTGVLFDLPIEFLESHNVNLTMRADYKYLNIDHGEHLLTLGFMFGLHK